MKRVPLLMNYRERAHVEEASSILRKIGLPE